MVKAFYRQANSKGSSGDVTKLFPIIHVVISISDIWNTWGYNAGNWAELAPLLSSNGYDTVFSAIGVAPRRMDIITRIDGMTYLEVSEERNHQN